LFDSNYGKSFVLNKFLLNIYLCYYRYCCLGTDKNDFKSVSSNYHIQSLENGSLVIKEVEKSDQGLYVCEAGNGVGVDISIVVKLSVNIGAHFKKSFQVIRVLKGDTIRMTCEAFGEKPLSIKWIRDRNDIDLISDKK
jgi:Down syndrome cell adhesion protein